LVCPGRTAGSGRDPVRDQVGVVGGTLTGFGELCAFEFFAAYWITRCVGRGPDIGAANRGTGVTVGWKTVGCWVAVGC